LHNIVDDHVVIAYTSKNPDTADALARLDADSDNSNSVILIYSQRSEPIANFGTSSSWNREYIWCNSYGIDKRGPAYSDLHNLKPADASVNTARSNKIYDNSDTDDAKYQKPGHPEIFPSSGSVSTVSLPQSRFILCPAFGYSPRNSELAMLCNR
jgi:endonuclease I